MLTPEQETLTYSPFSNFDTTREIKCSFPISPISSKVMNSAVADSTPIPSITDYKLGRQLCETYFFNCLYFSYCQFSPTTDR